MNISITEELIRQGNSTPLSFIQDEKKRFILILLKIYIYSLVSKYTLPSYV